MPIQPPTAVTVDFPGERAQTTEDKTESPIGKVPYNLDFALSQGANYEDIAKYLSSETGYDYDYARNTLNVTDIEIIDYLRESRDLSKTEAFWEATGREGTKFGSAIAGATGGGKLGSLAGPWGTGVGIAAGFGAGYFLGDTLEDLLFPEGPIPAHARRAFVAGETVGGTVPMIAVPYGLTAKAMANAPNIFMNIAKAARTHPKSFLTGEITSGASSAVAAYLAEQQYPGRLGPRVTSEVLGGVLNPIGTVSRWLPTISSAVVKASRRTTRTGAQKVAADLLAKIMEQYGEDIPSLIKALNESDEIAQMAADAGIDFIPRSAATITGSRTLSLIEQSLATKNAAMSSELKVAVENQLGGIHRLVDLMMATKDPAILRHAAVLKNNLISGIVDARIGQATDRAAFMIGKLNSNDPDAIKKASKVVEDLTSNALKDVRAQETALWKRIDRTTPVETSNVLELMGEYANRHKARIAAGEFPKLVKSYLRQFGYEDVVEEISPQLSLDAIPAAEVAPSDVALGDLIDFRSDMLTATREARAAGKYADARIYGEMAEVALKDMGIIRETATITDENALALADATSFSRQLNDSFTRAFGGAILRTRRTGERAVPPELVGARLFAGGADATSLRMDQLEEAVQLMSFDAGEAGAERAAQRIGSLREAEQTILRENASKLIDPVSGEVNPRQLEQFITKNESILRNFPDLAQDLTNVGTTQALLKGLNDATSLAYKRMDDAVTFQMFLGKEDPSDVWQSVLGTPGKRSDEPVKALRAMARFALDEKTIKRLTALGIPNAAAKLKRGMTDSLLDRAYVYAGGTSPEGGQFSFKAMESFLFDAIARNQPSPMGILRMQRVVDDAEVTRLHKLFREAAKIEDLIKLSGPDLNEALTDAPQAMVDLVVRIIGAKGGTTLSRMTPGDMGGGSIIVAGAGSRAARGYFHGISASHLRDVLTEAARSPRAMALLLERGKKQGKRILVTKIDGKTTEETVNIYTSQGKAKIKAAEDAGTKIDLINPDADPIAKSRRLRAFLINAGFDVIEDEDVDNTFYPMPTPPGIDYVPVRDYDEVVPNMSPRSIQQMRDLQRRDLPNQARMEPISTPGPQVPQGAPSSPGGVPPSRSQYAAIFPNDPISGLIRQKEQMGIAALMQEMQGQA